MAEKPASEKTELPTQKRINKAREKGQVVQSQELGATVSIIVLIGILTVTAPAMLQWFTIQIREGMSCRTGMFVDSQTFMKYFSGKISGAALAMSPVLAALMGAGIVAGIAVSGLNFAPGAIRLKLEEIDPVKGFGRLFDVKTAVKLGVSIAKLIFVSTIVYFYLRGKINAIAATQWDWSWQIMVSICKLISGMVIRICVGLVIIAVIDVAFQKWKYTQDMKMTKQEVKQENKEADGSPEIKSRIRRIQMEMTKKRMLQEIPKANVVLVNPTHYAIALRYDAKTMEAPIVLAKGADHLAEQIRKIARAHGIPIIRRPALTRAIYAQVENGDPIPTKLFSAVAEVLAMIYRLRHRRV